MTEINTIKYTGDLNTPFKFEKTYVAAENWEQYTNEIYPEVREELQSWARPGVHDWGERPQWLRGYYQTSLPKSAFDEKKQEEFKKTLINDAKNVLEDLNNYSNWDNYWDNVRSRENIKNRGPGYIISAFGLFATPLIGIIGPLTAGTGVLMTEASGFYSGKRRIKDLKEGLEKLINEENITIDYIEDNFIIETPIEL